MTPVRLLLLALIVDGVTPPIFVSAATEVAPSNAWNEGDLIAHVEHAESRRGGADEDAAGPLTHLCASCAAEPEMAAPSEDPVSFPSCVNGFTPNGDPFTEEHQRLPFRPPMAA